MKDIEEVVAEMGGQGWYQKRFLYLVLTPLYMFLPCTWMNEIMVFNVPDHWCHHPAFEARQASNLTRWKNCFLAQGLAKSTLSSSQYSQCQISLPGDWTDDRVAAFWSDSEGADLPDDLCPLEMGADSTRQVDCALGWTYDKSDFESTLVSEKDWVCDDAHFETTGLTIGKAGIMVGLSMFGYLGDRFGRRRLVWVTIAIILVTQLGMAAVAKENTEIYMALKFVSSTAFLANYQLPFSVLTEIIDASYRSWAVGITWVAWITSCCALPLLAWLLGNWQSITVVSVLPMATIFLAWRWVPESPRWLLTQEGGHIRAAQIIREIARVNGRPEPANLEDRLRELNQAIASEPHYGYLSLFSHWRLGFYTVCIILALTASNFVYYQLMIYINFMGGNLFLNFFLLSLIELPSTVLAMWIADAIGRRWSQVFPIFLNVLCFAALCLVADHPEDDVTLQWVVVGLCVLAKLNCNASFYIVYLQCVEIFPTCIRNSGLAFTFLLSYIFNLFGPYITTLARMDKRIPHLIMGCICIIGTVAASLLPETLGCELPETLETATKFGKGEAYFSWRPKLSRRNGQKTSTASTKPSKMEETSS